jgi:hypothetical protein
MEGLRRGLIVGALALLRHLAAHRRVHGPALLNSFGPTLWSHSLGQTQWVRPFGSEATEKGMGGGLTRSGERRGEV